MLSVSEFLIEVYVLIDDLLKTVLCGVKLRQRGKPPRLSDAEVLTMEVAGEFLGLNHDKSIWLYFSRHWRHFFPDLPSRTRFVRQAADLWHVKQLLHALLADRLAARAAATIHVVDAFPIRLCRLARARRCRLFRGEAATGYCASQKERYHGFKGHLLVNDEGVIAAGSVTGANIDDREGLEDVLDGITGVLLGDKGYLDWELWWRLWQRHIQLKTPLRKNMAPRPAAEATPGQRARRKIVETVIGQLQERFGLTRTLARDTWHLTSRIARKFLAHTVACFINLKHGREPLQFDGLVLES